jgi:hypothetical protein
MKRRKKQQPVVPGDDSDFPQIGPVGTDIPISVEGAVRRIWAQKRMMYLTSYRGKTESAARAAEAAFHAGNAAWASGAYTRGLAAKEEYERQMRERMRAKDLEKERLLQVERGLSQEEKDKIAREKQEAEDARQLAIFMAEKAEAERLRQQRKQDEWEAFQKEGLSGRCRAAQAESKDDHGTWTWSCRDWGGEGRRSSAVPDKGDNVKHFTWVDEYEKAPEYFSGTAEDQKMFEKLAMEPIRKACVVALAAAVEIQGRVNRMLEHILPLVWREHEQRMLVAFKAEVEAKTKKGRQKKRADKGKFCRGAEFAVISAPGESSVAEGATMSEYDWWWGAVENRRNIRKLDYAFTCVWLSDQTGHCTSAGSCKTGVVPYDAEWLCRHLAAGYNCAAPAPACGNCSWTDPWCTAVMHCESDDQDLRFAFLESPASATQPEFECTAKGFEGKYYVGMGQKIELEWAQNRRGLVVKPITKMNIIALDVAEATMDAAKRLRAAMTSGEDTVLDVGDWACLHWRKTGMVGAEAMEMKAERELADTQEKVDAFLAYSVRKMAGKLALATVAWGKSGKVSKEAEEEVIQRSLAHYPSRPLLARSLCRPFYVCRFVSYTVLSCYTGPREGPVHQGGQASQVGQWCEAEGGSGEGKAISQGSICSKGSPTAASQRVRGALGVGVRREDGTWIDVRR